MNILRVRPGRLAPRDAVFVYDETDRHLSHIVAIYCFADDRNAPLTTSEVREWARARLGHSPLFHRRLRRTPFDLDLPYWVPAPVANMADHVFLDAPGSWPAAQARIAELASARMDLVKPPWEIHVLDRVRGVPGIGTATVVVLKLHHSVCDGVATRELEAKLFGDAPAPEVELGGDDLIGAAVRTAATALTAPARFALGMARTRASGDAGAVTQQPVTRFNRDIHAPLTMHVVTLPMAEVRAVQAACPVRVTVNDLMLTTVSGALAAYLAEYDETPEASLAAMVPMSMRGVAQWDSVNQLTQMFVDLHTDIDDPVRRLLAIGESAKRAKATAADPATLRTESRVETAPALLLRAAGWARTLRRFDEATSVPLSNTTISNVPPVRDDLRFAGRPLVRVLGALPIHDGDGLRHLITSQGAELAITVTTNAVMMPDPEHYGDLLLSSFRRLADAVTARGAVG
ncbi:wax ester/triacylglycerol synthase family O-acyltransferase [Nocardia coubleae]|uniref:Diacylglycerol O-acyltransferase n=1 Tax=Nocardia coubleae TaxID=356147 RepID=A0A846W9I0_9NOCA|nr:wax ester/triacylglycerol synthase family O-acyltransferase [Nocardia coubleae]NKX89911.1 wax ester/triacylglycerol synthase family O-acyltransferase [Nocardia coubleae]